MNILLTGAWQDAQNYIEYLENLGHSICFLQQEKEEELPCSYAWPEAVVCNGLFLYHDIQKFTNLQYIQLTSAGMDRVDMEYIKEKGIEIHNAHGVYSIPIAEFVLTSVLEVYKKFEVFHDSQKNHLWNKQRNIKELDGSTVCIIGCGSIGNECAKRFKAFGCKVIGVNRTLRKDPYYDCIYSIDALNSILEESDIILLTLPLTKETKYLMNKEKFNMCKKGSILVNVARGALINTNDLLECSSRFEAILLDVFEKEPIDINSSLWEKENVVITPHNSFVSNRNQERLNKVILENLEGK